MCINHEEFRFDPLDLRGSMWPKSLSGEESEGSERKCACAMQDEPVEGGEVGWGMAQGRMGKKDEGDMGYPV